jgi:hypothetical protein
MAREGGSRAFAAFQFTPPLGSNMLGRADTPSGVHESLLCLYPLRNRSAQCQGRRVGGMRDARRWWKRRAKASMGGRKGMAEGGVQRVVVAVECRA